MSTPAIGLIALFVLVISLLACAADERPDEVFGSDWPLILIAILTSPLWLPVAAIIYLSGLLAGEDDKGIG